MFFSILVLVPLCADGIVIKCFSFRRFPAVYAYDGLFTAVYMNDFSVRIWSVEHMFITTDSKLSAT